jgi:hypothetical protein
MLLAEVTRA